MDTIESQTIIDIIPFLPNEKLGDLINFQGPILSLFKSERGDYYLYYWVDVDYNYNRWLVFRVTDDDLQSFLHKKTLSLHQLVMYPRDGFLYKIEMDVMLNIHNPSIVFPANLPDSHIPDEDSYYEDTPNLNNYSLTEVLNIHFTGGDTIGFGKANLSTIGPILNDFQSIVESVAFNLYDSDFKIRKGRTTKAKKLYDDIKSYSDFVFTGLQAASFSMFFKPVENEIDIDGLNLKSSEIVENIFYLFNNLERGTNLNSINNHYESEVFLSLRRLFKDIEDKELEVNFSWVDLDRQKPLSKDFNKESSGRVLNKLRELEFKNSVERVSFVGKFSAVNLNRGSYHFVDLQGITVSYGSFNKLLLETMGSISLSTVYKIDVSRAIMTKSANFKHRNEDYIIGLEKVEVK